MDNREKHRQLAEELLLACVELQDSLCQEAGVPQGHGLSQRQVVELLRPKDDYQLPTAPNGYLVLPKLPRGPRLWPLLGVFFLEPVAPARSRLPGLELAALEVILVPDAPGSGAAGGCVAFRFEPPTCFWYWDTPGDHDCYHMQFVTTRRVARWATNIGECLPLPDECPAFPLPARDFGSLVLALLVSLYGREAIENPSPRGPNWNLEARTRRSAREACVELGIGTPEEAASAGGR